MDDDFPHIDTRFHPRRSQGAGHVTPETVFLQWLLSLPAGTPVDVAAQGQIDMIDAHATNHPDATRLRELFAAAAGEPPCPILN